jgi:adenine deaminase
MGIPEQWIAPPDARRRLRAVASGEEPPDLVVSGGRVLNVFNGRLERRDIGIAEGRIAWLADGPPDDAPRIDVSDRVVVPGLIEPHAHPEVLYGPLALADAAARHGTTTLCADLLTMVVMLDDDALGSLLDVCREAPARMLWALRPCAEGGGPVEDRLTASRMIGLMDRFPSIVAVGEVTAWRSLVDGDPRLDAVLADASRRNLRVNGHLPGASVRSLERAVVAGITDDHECTTAEEAVARLDLGFWTMVRHSSLRPDAARIAAGLLGHPALHRTMVTTDGPVAADLVRGHLDTVVREVIGAGLDPVDAVRMASLNPATYYGIDRHVGAVAPGRFADLVVVDDMQEFRPQVVLRGGEPVRSAVRPSYPVTSRGAPIVRAELSAADLVAATSGAPTVRLDGIITRRLPVDPPSGSRAVLLARDGSWRVGMNVANVEVRALASSFTGTGDVLLLGSDADLLVAAYHRLVDIEGGIVTPTRTVPLPLFGVLSDLPVDELADVVASLSSEVKVAGADVPLEFLLLFLTLGVLPEVRLTPGGVLEVKTGRILAEPTGLRRR